MGHTSQFTILVFFPMYNTLGRPSRNSQGGKFHKLKKRSFLYDLQKYASTYKYFRKLPTHPPL